MLIKSLIVADNAALWRTQNGQHSTVLRRFGLFLDQLIVTFGGQGFEDLGLFAS
jgi:hypothetical protein